MIHTKNIDINSDKGQHQFFMLKQKQNAKVEEGRLGILCSKKGEIINLGLS